MFELLKNFLNWRNDRDTNVAVADEPTPTPVSRQATRPTAVSRSQAAARPTSPPAGTNAAIATANPPNRLTAPVAPPLAPISGDTIGLPLRSILARLPEEFTGIVNCPPETDIDIALSRDKILQQLPKGVVRLPFGDIRRAAPVGTFVNFDKLDHQAIVIPLEDIVPRLGAAFLPRRADQKKIAIPENIAAPFNPSGSSSYTDTHTAAARVVAAPKLAPTPAPLPIPAPVQAKETPRRVQPVQDAEIPEQIFFSRKTAPAPASSAPIAATPAGETVTPPAIPAEPEAETVETAAPVEEAEAPASFDSALSYNTSSEPVSFTETPAPAPIAPISFLEPIAPPAPVATELVPEFETPIPALPVPIEARETTFFRRGCLRMPVSVLTEKWPTAVLDEVAHQDLSRAQLEIPANEVEPGLRSGKLSFTWRQIRTWLTGVPKSDEDSPNDSTPVELPLRIVAPLFLSQRSLDNPTKKVNVPETIPNLFGPGSAGFKTNFVKKIEEAVERQQDTLPAAAPAPVAYTPATQPVPAPIAPPATTDTSVIRRANQAIHEIFGEAEKQTWSPIEIVRRTTKLKGVHGALICTQDGLMVAENYASIAGNETFCALITQMFNRVSNHAKELVVGLPSQMSFVAESTTYQAFRTGRVIYIVISNPGERLPLAELQVVAEYLSKTSR